MDVIEYIKAVKKNYDDSPVYNTTKYLNPETNDDSPVDRDYGVGYRPRSIPDNFVPVMPQAPGLQDPATSVKELATGGPAQLVQPGPGRLGFKDAGLVDSMKIRFDLGDDIVEKLNILMETDYPKSNKPEVIQKRIDDFAIKFKKITNRLPTASEIRGFGASSTMATSTKKAKYMKEGINYMEETDEMKKIKRIDVVGTEIEQKILNLSKNPKYIKEDGTPNIKKLAKDIYPDRKSDDARKQIRKTLERTIDYEGKKNIPGEITSAKQSKKNALENIKIAQKKAGIKTTEQADLVIDKILSQNEIYQKMSVEDIAKDKDFLKRLRVQIDSVTGDVTFDGYTKKSPVRGKVFTDLELAQHAKDKAMKYKLIAPDHINPKATRMQNVGYPINFQSATYMENSHLGNARKYLLKNPDGNWKPIDNYLSSKNLTIRGPEFKQKYGFKLPIKFNPETGTSNIVESSLKKTVPNVGTKTGRKILGKAFNLGLGPTGVLGLTYGLRPEDGYDLSRTGDRLGFEAEAAFAKPLVKGSLSVTDKIKNPLARKIAERGSLALMSPAMALRLARVATPLGLASLGLEGVYHLGKYTKNRRAELAAMSPKERDELRRKSDDFSFGEYSGAANGGLMNLTRTKPPERGPQYRGLDYLRKHGRGY